MSADDLRASKQNLHVILRDKHPSLLESIHRKAVPQIVKGVPLSPVSGAIKDQTNVGQHRTRSRETGSGMRPTSSLSRKMEARGLVLAHAGQQFPNYAVHAHLLSEFE